MSSLGEIVPTNVATLTEKRDKGFITLSKSDLTETLSNMPTNLQLNQSRREGVKQYVCPGKGRHNYAKLESKPVLNSINFVKHQSI
jgi:hypothetical protein